MTNLWNSTAADQAKVDVDAEELSQCELTQKSSVAGKLTALNLAKETHKACRNTESTKAVETKAAKDKLEELVTSIPAPPACPQYKQDLSSVTTFFDSQYNSVKKWYEDYTPAFQAKHVTYTAATQASQNQQAQCDTLQTLWEQAYCSYAGDLKTACAVGNSCRQRRLAAYRSTVSLVKKGEQNRKALFKSTRTVICHLQVVLGTHSNKDATKGHNGTHSIKNATEGHNQCVDLTANHNVSSLNINYPAEPQLRSCSTRGFTRAPCDANWIRDELTPLLPSNVKARNCSRCTWETPAPTASPTPAPTPAPTPVPGPAPGSDLGYNYPVTCSSGCKRFYGDDFMASNGVIDETYGRKSQSGGLAHTNSGRNEWVEVDFKKEFLMGKVTIWNGWQWGCCMSRINPFRLVFFDTTHNEVSRVSRLQAKTTGDGETPVLLTTPVKARYVRVQLDEHSSYLHIAELRAYAPA